MQLLVSCQSEREIVLSDCCQLSLPGMILTILKGNHAEKQGLKVLKCAESIIIHNLLNFPT